MMKALFHTGLICLTVVGTSNAQVHTTPPPPPPPPVQVELVEEDPSDSIELVVPESVLEKEYAHDGEEIVDFPDDWARYPGGMTELMKYVHENLQYPDAMADEVGKIYLSFIVETDGSVSHVTVERGMSEEMDEEAIRVIESMPKWIPAKNKGVPVRSRVRLPIIIDVK